MSEFITIKLTEKKPKTNVYEVCNKKTGYYLGEIMWWGAWRQYCFFPDGETLYERKCLRAIAEFIDSLMEERKRQKKALKGQTEINDFNGLKSGHIID